MAKRRTTKATRAAKPSGPGRLALQSIPVAKIKVATYNPRQDLQPGDPEYERLKRSIEKFGYVDPLIWNKKTGNLVGGHQRLKILVNEHQATKVDVSVVNLPAVDEKALNVALNKITGEWDNDALIALLNELEEDDAIDATITGFDGDEIDKLLHPHPEVPETAGTERTVVFREQGILAVQVQVKDAADQRAIYGEMRTRGYVCQLLTI